MLCDGGIEYRIVVADTILFEALQGARDVGHAQKLDTALSAFPLVCVLGADLPRTAAANFRHLRGLKHRAQNLKQIFAARMLYLKVLDRPDVLHK
jgi:hypothetical protein